MASPVVNPSSRTVRWTGSLPGTAQGSNRTQEKVSKQSSSIFKSCYQNLSQGFSWLKRSVVWILETVGVLPLIRWVWNSCFGKPSEKVDQDLGSSSVSRGGVGAVFSAPQPSNKLVNLQLQIERLEKKIEEQALILEELYAKKDNPDTKRLIETYEGSGREARKQLLEKSAEFLTLAKPLEDSLAPRMGALVLRIENRQVERERNHREVDSAKIADKLTRALQRCEEAKNSEMAIGGRNFNVDLSEMELSPDYKGSDHKLYYKLSESTQKGYHVVIGHAQGQRPSMEDQDINSCFDFSVKGKSYEALLTGVFDGHGGAEAAKFISENLQAKLLEKLEKASVITDQVVFNALKTVFAELHDSYFGFSGTTATVVFTLKEKGKDQTSRWVANVGDSRTLSIGSSGQVTQLSEDAKPDDPRICAGILKRGGNVWGSRIGGSLAVGRSLGDHGIKGVNPRPSITKTEVKSKDIVVAVCDGITDVLTTRQIGDFVHANRHKTDQELVQSLLWLAWKNGSTDNLTVTVQRKLA